MYKIKNRKLLLIIFSYLIVKIYLMTIKPIINTNLIDSIFWILIIIYINWYTRKVYVRFNNNKNHIIYIIIISLVNITIFFNMGFLFGFSKSPYSHNLLRIFENIFMQIIPIIGIELTRAVIINRNKNNKFALVLITILLFLIEINYNILFNLLFKKEELFKYICSTIIPLFSNSILSSYLVSRESYIITLIYNIFGKIVILLLPILPNIDWFIYGCANILSTTIVYVLFKYKFLKTKKNFKNNKTLFDKMSYIIALCLSISLVCFVAGIFKYEPIVILSNSMKPVFSRGDVVIFKKVDKREIKKNDIIIYSIGEQNVAHRVIDITEEDGTLYFKTKGDNNNAPDMIKIKTDNVKGVYAFHVKYAGFPSIWLRDYFNEEATKVETK